MHRRIIKIALWTVLTAALSVSFELSAPPATSRVVAIGDIHGDFDAFVGILQRAGLVDSSGHWAAHNVTFVQLGDIVDRGPKSRQALDLLMELQKEAPRMNSHVVQLIGNHEALNIYGDLQYVNANDYASYADDKSERRRKEAYEAYSSLPDAGIRLSEDEWMKAHPPGFIEQREAMGPSGKYGKWLRSLPAIAKVNDSIFLHGGISTKLISWKIEKINEEIDGEIKSFDICRQYMDDQKITLPFYTLKEMTDAAAAAMMKKATDTDPNRKKMLQGFLGYGSWMSINTDGPLWFRGYAEWSDAEGAPQIQQLAEAFGVARFIVGHTPQPGEIKRRFDGRVYLIDTGMLDSTFFPGGRASALELLNGKITAIYPDGTKLLQ